MDFRHRGHRYREYLNLRDTRDGRREAEHIKRRVEGELRGGTFDYARLFPNNSRAASLLAAQPTLGEFAQSWLDERTPRLRPQTLYDYQCILRAYILSHSIAQMRLTEVSEAHINLLIKDLSERPSRSGKPLSARLINSVLARLRDMFKIAYRRHLIADNPMAFVKNLDEVKPEIDPFEPDEFCCLLAAAVGWERVSPVLIFAGLRPNEALALYWSDIDRHNDTLRVRRNLTRFGSFGPPKTERSDRTVNGPAGTRGAPGATLAIPARRRTGVPWPRRYTDRPCQFRNRNWPRILRRAGLTARPLYQCRHTFARLPLKPVRSAMGRRQLGHRGSRWSFKSTADGRGRRKAARSSINGANHLPSICPNWRETHGPVREGPGSIHNWR